MQEQIFDSKELDKNEENKKKLLKLISSGDSILMVGAGCSAPIYPTWSQFVEILEKEAKLIDTAFNEKKDDFLLFADKVKKCLSDDRYYTLIYNVFKPKKPTHLKYHEIMCSLNFRGITTTNYDTILENSLLATTGNPDNSVHFEGTTKVKIFEFLSSLNQNSAYPKRVVHLHGKYDARESIVLCGEEYLEKYGFPVKLPNGTLFGQIKNGKLAEEEFKKLLLNYGYEWTLRRKLLWSILATRRVVFIGFSMNDPYFTKMFDFVSNDLNPFGSDTHFLILRITRQNKISCFQFAERLKAQYGIETVFFIDDENFKGLENFVLEIGNELQEPKTEEKEEVTKKSVQTSMNEEVNEKLLRLNRKQIFDENK
ncbi:MAG: SIR2 family protein [Ginsengibacter sp.]